MYNPSASELPDRKIPGANPIGGCDVEGPQQKPRFKESDKIMFTAAGGM
jgi:hypothetical protein